MIVNHNRREVLYKSPYGAVPTGQAVTLRVSVNPLEETIKKSNCITPTGSTSFMHRPAHEACRFATRQSADVLWYEHTLP